MRHPAPTRAIALAAVLFAFAVSGCGKTKPPTADTVPPEAVVEDDNDNPDVQAPEPESPIETPRAADIEDADPIEGTPPRFTEDVPQFRQAARPGGGVEVVADDPVPLDMIRVPGDAAQGIAPFYLGETEVTWAMMESWMYCRDILDVEEIERLIGEGLRPTPLYGEIAVQFKAFDPGQPGVSLTRLTCESFCVWLSEKTGRRYRLPTPDEWVLALHLGGGCPEDPEELLAIAFIQENALLQEDPFWGPLDPDDPDSVELITSAPIKSLAPNALGIYDMLGNVGEWVVEPGGAAYQMGGYFAVPAAELTADWTDEEDHEVWNAFYPQMPPSRFWYWGQHHFQGFRLVCEVESAGP